MICPECQHDTSTHRLYGCHAGDAVLREGELAALREKARLWDALAERLALSEWRVHEAVAHGYSVTIDNRKTGMLTSAGTLADAVRLAMESEGR